MRPLPSVLTAMLLAAAIPALPAAGQSLHDPIVIDGDADFAAQAQAEGWPGDGSPGNPYVIAGYRITDTLVAVTIRSTTVAFALRDLDLAAAWVGVSLAQTTGAFEVSGSSITSGGSGVNLFETGPFVLRGLTTTSQDFAISLYRVAGGTIEDNVLSTSSFGGVVLEEGGPLTVARNVLHGGRIDVGAATRAEVVDNVLLDQVPDSPPILVNGVTGGGRVARNEVHHQDTWGILVQGSEGIVVEDNVVRGPGDEGVGIGVYGHNTLVRRNDVRGAGRGIEVNAFTAPSQNNVVQDNTVEAFNGILVRNGVGTVVRDNAVVAVGTYGIRLQFGAGNLAEGNTVTGGPVNGLHLNGGTGNILRGNTAEGALCGLCINGGAEAALAEDNTARSPMCAACQYGGAGSVLRGNDLAWAPCGGCAPAAGGPDDVEQCGLCLYGTTGGTYEDNDITAPACGICSTSSTDGTLRGNRLGGADCGLCFFLADGFTVASNRVVDNDLGIGLRETKDNLFYDNYLDNLVNANITYPTGASPLALVGSVDLALLLLGVDKNTWSVPKRAGTNILGGPWVGGNYWSDATSMDVDGDGLGEVPHWLLPYGSIPAEVVHHVFPDAPYGPFDLAPLVPDLVQVRLGWSGLPVPDA